MKNRVLLVILALVITVGLVVPDAQANCPAGWEACRATATRLYFADQISTTRYFDMLVGCEVEYLGCVFGSFLGG